MFVNNKVQLYIFWHWQWLSHYRCLNISSLLGDLISELDSKKKKNSYTLVQWKIQNWCYKDKLTRMDELIQNILSMASRMKNISFCGDKGFALKSSEGYGLYQTLEEGSTRGVMDIIAGNEHSDTNSNPGRDWLHFP